MGDETHARDPEAMARIAEEFDEMADRLDRLDETMPEHTDPGIFKPYVTDGVNTLVSDVATFVIRLRAAADRLRASAGIYVLDEDENERTILDRLDDRWLP